MRDELIINNIRLVRYVIHKMNLHHRADEYYDAGLIGLVKAANKFNPDKGIKFSSFAVTCIRNEILIEIRKEYPERPISLDITVSVNGYDNKNELTLLDMIPDSFNMEEYIIEKEKYDVMNKALLALTDRELTIFKLYYGRHDMTQKEIAMLLGTTQSNMSRIMKNIIKKLRKEVSKGGSYE